MIQHPFIDLVQTTIMINYIQYPNGPDGAITPQSFIKSMIAEYILKTLFLTGSLRNSAMTKRLRIYIGKKIRLSKRSIKVINNLKSIILKATGKLGFDETLRIITAQIEYGFPSGDLKKPLLKLLVKTALEEVASVPINGNEESNRERVSVGENLMKSTVLIYLLEKTGYECRAKKMMYLCQNPLRVNLFKNF